MLIWRANNGKWHSAYYEFIQWLKLLVNFLLKSLYLKSFQFLESWEWGSSHKQEITGVVSGSLSVQGFSYIMWEEMRIGRLWKSKYAYGYTVFKKYYAMMCRALRMNLILTIARESWLKVALSAYVAKRQSKWLFG